MADPREQVPEQDERQWQDDMSWEAEYQLFLDEVENENFRRNRQARPGFGGGSGGD